MTFDELRALARSVYPGRLDWNRARLEHNRGPFERGPRFVARGDGFLLEVQAQAGKARRVHLTAAGGNTDTLGRALALMAHILVLTGWQEDEVLRLPALLREVRETGTPFQYRNVLLQWFAVDGTPLVGVSAELDPVLDRVESI